ncbi:hypothetical protein [Levilactobacillus enshiensis]|uniref:hypothetical protein n=1 Tax=Levilactobacillus enshiensis TaxID=2590213 RepID=UPI001179D9C6|nr:hypothetical protein [Levilactobacillus enshiensis]
MIDQKMWQEWIRSKMELVSQRQMPTELAEESYMLERNELDEHYLPQTLDIDDLPRYLVVYLYGAYGNELVGYVLTSGDLDAMYVAGVLVNGRLKWSELEGEIE